MTPDQLRFEPARLAEYRLRVAVGAPGAPDGRTRVQLDGSGRLEASQRFGDAAAGAPPAAGAPSQGAPGIDVADAARKEPVPDQGRRDREAKGEVPRERVERMFFQASLMPWGREFPSRPGIPDEAVVEWAFDTTTGERATLRLWLREAEQDATVGPVLRAMRDELARVADSDLYL